MNESPGRLIALLYRKAQIFWAKALKDTEIGTAEYPILLRLYQKDGLTQEEITRDLAVDKSAVTRALQSLLNKGLIERRKDEHDRRCNHIFLTGKADSCRPIIQKAQIQWNNILQKHMTEEEKKELFRLLERAGENIKESDNVPIAKETDNL